MQLSRKKSSRGPGVAPQTSKREHYLRLMSSGMNNSQACRVVGVNRRTGTRWRYGRTETSVDGRQRHYRPIGACVVDISDRYLSEEERIGIADGLHAGMSVRRIATQLGRSPATVSREIRRNSDEQGRYRPHAAHKLAASRRPRPKERKLTGNAELHQLVQDGLNRKWSPEQTCAMLKQKFPDRAEMRVCHETVYQALYLQGRGELRRELARALRTGRTCRKPRRTGEARRRRFPDMVMLSERPGEADDRAVPGHWEGDLIMGEGNRSAIGTLVERSSRFVMLVHLPHGKTAEAVREALTAAVQQLPVQLRRSLAWDQGTEMGEHAKFSVAVDVPVFFCDPGSPWQRGSNENTNGLLRQYFPKGTDLSVHTAEHLAAVAAELNERPRKTLDWQTPAQRLDRMLQPVAA